MRLPLSLVLSVIVALVVGATAVRAESEPRHPLVYWGKPISGRIVDAETKQPLDGVIIVAQWVLPGGPRMHIVEVVSDRDGRYFVPGWGPKPRNLIAGPLGGYYDPQILCFRAGYSPLFLTNEILDNYESVRTSIWDGKTVEMGRFKGSPEEWTDKFLFLQGYLDWGGTHTRWQQYPRMILAVIEEVKKLPKNLRSRLGDYEAFARLTEEEVREYVKRVTK